MANADAPTPEVIERLEAQEDWPALYERLAAHAQARINQVTWTRGPDALPKGKTAEGFAEEAVESLFTGRRTWKIEQYPDLEGVLKGIISSLVSNLVTSKEHKRSVDIQRSEEPGDFYEAVAPSDADADLMGKELMETMNAAVADDPDLEMVFHGMLGEYPTEEVAELIDADRDRVYQLRRKVKRRIRKALASQTISVPQ